MHILSQDLEASLGLERPLASGMAGREEEEEGGPIKPGQMRRHGPHTMFLLGTTYTPFTKCLARETGARVTEDGIGRECFSTNVGSSWSAGRFLG